MWICNKNKLYKIQPVDQEIWFWFFIIESKARKRSHFGKHYILENITFCVFLMINSFNWRSFIVWLPLLFETWGNMFVAIICFPECDDINFEISHSFLIKPFFYIAKNANISRTKRAFNIKEKSFFIIFKGNCY